MLRPEGRLLIADHIRSTNPLMRASQHLLELYSIPVEGEHYTRRPSLLLEAAGFAIEESDRHPAGAIEHVRARPV